MKIMSLGDRLRSLRKAKNVSLTGIGQSTSISREFLLQIEGGELKPTSQILEGWASSLAIPPSYAIGDKNLSTPLANLPDRLSASEIAWRSSANHLSLVFQTRRFLCWITGVYRDFLFLWQTHRLHRNVDPGNHSERGIGGSSCSVLTKSSRPYPANIILAIFGGKLARRDACFATFAKTSIVDKNRGKK
jgi:transcriptional regulator with XRE-family HTH domain